MKRIYLKFQIMSEDGEEIFRGQIGENANFRWVAPGLLPPKDGLESMYILFAVEKIENCDKIGE